MEEFIVKKNKGIVFLIIVLLFVLMITGCSSNHINKKSIQSEEKSENSKYSIVCTTFPQYDWIREIIGDQKENFELTLLLDQGVDLHSYQPTAEDISKIVNADMFVYVGGESDEWVADALAQSENKKMLTVNLMEALGSRIKEEVVKEGMEHEHEEAHEEDNVDTSENEEREYDEHIWLSLKNAILLTKTLSEAIQNMDAQNQDQYAKNTEVYIDQLSEIDKAFEETVRGASVKTLLFGDRFPFRYFADDYGLDYYAAFVGCSAETEASFQTILFLSEKIDELELPAILVIENSDHKIAETIKENTIKKNQKILTMNSLQSVTDKELMEGTTYLKAMEDNLEVLKKAMKRDD